MARRTAGNSAERLKVLLGDDAATPTVMADEAPPDEQPVAADAGVARDPDAYGVRVVWQSEAELLEAAEFLLATRVRRDESLRVLHDAHEHAAEHDSGGPLERDEGPVG